MVQILKKLLPNRFPAGLADTNMSPVSQNEMIPHIALDILKIDQKTFMALKKATWKLGRYIADPSITF